MREFSNRKIGDLTYLIIILLALFLIIFIKSPAQADEDLHINIYGPGQSKLNCFLAQPLSIQNKKQKDLPGYIIHFQDRLKKNLSFLPFIKQIKEQDILGGPEIKGLKARQIDWKRFGLSQVDALLTLGWQDKKDKLGQIEVRAYEVYSSNLIVGKGYILERSSQIPEAVNKFCRELMFQLTGKSGFFGSRLAFVNKNQTSQKEIFICNPQGNNLRQITDFQGVCLAPSWSWDGNKLAFTYISDSTHELGIWDNESGKTKTFLLAGNTIISSTFSPQGQLVVSTDPRGNPDIYSLSQDHRLDQTLIQNWAIDISPQFDQSGNKMVFVSSRLGDPHIFLKNFKTNNIIRVTYEGNYNTNPSISPDGRFVAFSRLTEKGHRIFMHNLKSGQERQLTFGPGNDEDPAWGPDSYFLAFSSSRTGRYKLYLTTRFGDMVKEIPISSGQATAPAWSTKLAE